VAMDVVAVDKVCAAMGCNVAEITREVSTRALLHVCVGGNGVCDAVESIGTSLQISHVSQIGWKHRWRGMLYVCVGMCV